MHEKFSAMPVNTSLPLFLSLSLSLSRPSNSCLSAFFFDFDFYGNENNLGLTVW